MADQDDPVYVISVAAQLAGMHAQTLRSYDRMGLVSPDRTSGGGRRYSQRNVDQLRTVARLSQDEGVSLNAIKRILELENQVLALQSRIGELEQEVKDARAAVEARAAEVHASYRRDLVPLNNAIVVWRPRPPGVPD
jgi:MerR family transcriptional regulator/heat shock protein HspR